MKVSGWLIKSALLQAPLTRNEKGLLFSLRVKSDPFLFCLYVIKILQTEQTFHVILIVNEHEVCRISRTVKMRTFIDYRRLEVLTR